MKYFLPTLIVYLVLVIINYFLMKKMNIRFYSGKTKEYAQLNEKEKKIMYMICSIAWIYYLPLLYFNTKKGIDKQ